MNFIDKIKNIFKPKKEEVKETGAKLSLYDVSDIKVPEFNNLSEANKDKVIKYEQQISVENQENIIKYNQEIAKEGEELSNLLIKYLYDLNEVIRKDDKTEYELNEINIDLCIQNIKIILIRDKIKELLQDSCLRTIAIEKFKYEYLKKEHKFIEIFSRLARIKRNMEIRSIEEAITRCKITIKTLEQQINAINNAINNNNIITDKVEIYNQINNKENKIKKEILLNKIKYIIQVYINLDCKFSTYEEIINILKEEKFFVQEEKLIELIAISEIELDKYIINNKDIMIPLFKEKLNDLSKNRITIDKQTELLNKISYLEILYETFKEDIDEFDKIRLYQIKFDVLTINILDWNENYLNKTTNREEIKIYKDIISSELQTFYNPEYKEEYRTVIKLILEKFRTDLLEVSDNKDVEDKIFNSYLMLSFILLVNYPGRYQKYINQCLDNSYIIERDSNILDYDIKLQYDDNIYLNEDEHDLVAYVDNNRFKILKKNYNDDIRMIIECAKSDDKWFNEIWLSDVFFDDYTHIEGKRSLIRSVIFLSYLFNKLEEQEIVYLKNDTLYFRDGITSISASYPFNFKKQIKGISFPKSVSEIKSDSFRNYDELQEIEFQDYKESKLLYKLLFENTQESDKLLKNIFCHISFLHNTQTLKKIILTDKNDGNIEIVTKDIFLIIFLIGKFGKPDYSILGNIIRKYIIKMIETKTDFNLKDYYEEKKLKK